MCVCLFLMQIFQGPSSERSAEAVVLAEQSVPVEVSAFPIQPPSSPRPSGDRSLLSLQGQLCCSKNPEKLPRNSSVPCLQKCLRACVGWAGSRSCWWRRRKGESFPASLLPSLVPHGQRGQPRREAGRSGLEALSSFTPRRCA